MKGTTVYIYVLSQTEFKPRFIKIFKPYLMQKYAKVCCPSNFYKTFSQKYSHRPDLRMYRWGLQFYIDI